MMYVEIPRTVLESAVLTSNNKDHRELCRTVVIIPNSGSVGIYAADGKRLFKTKVPINVALSSITFQPLNQPICLISEKAEVALKQLKQAMGRNAKNINTILITYDPAKPFVVLLSIGKKAGLNPITQALSELKIPVDLVDDAEKTKDFAKTLETLYDGIQNNIINKLASEEDKAKFSYYLPFVNYLTKVLNIMGEDYLNLNEIKITDDSSLNYKFSSKLAKNDENSPSYDVYLTIMGSYE